MTVVSEPGPLLAAAVLAGFLLACLAAATTGAVFRPGAWYASLDRPAWRPPDRLFGPAWLVIYLLIAAAGWLVWRQAGFSVASAPAFALYALQLVLNALWSWLAFGRRRLDLALVDMGALWLAIAATIIAFRSLEPIAAWLLAPYLAWVSFAFVLNLTLWRMNRRPGSAARVGRVQPQGGGAAGQD